jgi:hypothetical protein
MDPQTDLVAIRHRLRQVVDVKGRGVGAPRGAPNSELDMQRTP